jgi:AcrR family transcriptional regulator
MFASEYRILKESVDEENALRQAQIGKIVRYRTGGSYWSPKRGGAAVKQQKTDRRSQRTYQLVSSALAELLREKPYDEILVQEILDRAGVGRTTFYAHYFDKADVLDSMTEQILSLFTHQIAPSPTRLRVVPSLELFEHISQSPDQHFRALMRGHAGERLWEAMQAALCHIIEPALATHCAEQQDPSIPLELVAQYLADALLSLLKWWLAADMPYSPEQMEKVFQQLALPGVWAMLTDVDCTRKGGHEQGEGGNLAQ